MAISCTIELDGYGNLGYMSYEDSPQVDDHIRVGNRWYVVIGRKWNDVGGLTLVVEEVKT